MDNTLGDLHYFRNDGGMDQNISEPFGTVPQASESFGNVPNHSEDFGKLPNVSESATSSQPIAIKTENHTMTVREAARSFENAGVARTERSIVNWCQPNRQGASQLDCYFEENDHKYFITPQSVDRAIKEELAKACEQGMLPNPSERGTEERKEEPAPAARPASEAATPEGGSAKLRELELENRDLMITSRAKDMFIEQLRKDREAFVAERQQLIDQLISSSQQIGELETKLLQIEAPRERSERTQPVPNVAPAESTVPREPQVEYPPSY